MNGARLHAWLSCASSESAVPPGTAMRSTSVQLAVLVFAAFSGSPMLSAAEPLMFVDLPRLAFSVDRLGKSDHERIFYTANGNSIAFMVYPRDDPTWENIRTPDEALRNEPDIPLKDGERVLKKHFAKVQRKDGAWCVTCDTKIAGSSPQDDPKADTSWHLSRYVYIGDQIIIMQGCLFKYGDIDQDYRTFDLIVESIRLK
jgi:hypothetical protein